MPQESHTAKFEAGRKLGHDVASTWVAKYWTRSDSTPRWWNLALGFGYLIRRSPWLLSKRGKGYIHGLQERLEVIRDGMQDPDHERREFP